MADTIIVDGETYVRKSADGAIKIVVLQRGWVAVGRYSRDGDDCALTDASVIRTWGTKKGLGEIAAEGPKSGTTLDPAGTVTFHVLTTVLTLDCNEDKWASKL